MSVLQPYQLVSVLLSARPPAHHGGAGVQAANGGAAVHSGTTPGREEGGVEGREDWVGVGTVWGQARGVWGNGYHSREIRTPEGR